jgi:DNA gyrase subunit A
MGRTAAGVTGMNLGDDPTNEIVGIISVDKTSELPQSVLVVTEKGFGKRTYIDDPEDGEPIYRVTNRGGKGVKTLNVTDKTGKLISILNVVDGNHLMIINKSGIAIRLNVEKLRVMGRATQGVTLIKLDKKDSIAAVAKVIVEEGDEEEYDEEGNLIIVDIIAEEGEEIVSTDDEGAENDAEDTASDDTEE